MKDHLLNWHEKFQPLGPALKTPAKPPLNERAAELNTFRFRSFDHPSCTGGNAPSLSPQALVPSPAAREFKVGDGVRSRRYSLGDKSWSWGDLVVREVVPEGCRCDSVKRGSGLFFFSDLEHIQPFDTQQWVEWKGGECPVPADVRVDVRTRDGAIHTNTTPDFSWQHMWGLGDVVAYRVVQ